MGNMEYDDYLDNLKSNKLLSKRLKIGSVVGIFIGVLVMCLGFEKNNSDARWVQFELYNYIEFALQSPEDKEFFEGLIKAKKSNKVVYFKSYEIEDAKDTSKPSQSILLNIHDSQLRDKSFIERYSYGEPTKDFYNQSRNYFEKGSSWYIEYELEHSADYYSNIFKFIAYGVWGISFGALVISFAMDNWRKKKMAR